MNTYAVTFRVPDSALDDAMAVRFYDAFDDGVLMEAYGALVVTVHLDTDDVVAATQGVVPRLEEVLRVEIAALDPDLVNAADIARRTGRTRQSVQLLVDGKRGRGGFPPPVGVPGGSKVWRWAAVDAWFREHDGPDAADVELPVPPDCAAIIDGWLAARHRRRTSERIERLVFRTTIATDVGGDLLTDALRAAVDTTVALRVQREVELLESS